MSRDQETNCLRAFVYAGHAAWYAGRAIQSQGGEREDARASLLEALKQLGANAPAGDRAAALNSVEARTRFEAFCLRVFRLAGGAAHAARQENVALVDSAIEDAIKALYEALAVVEPPFPRSTSAADADDTVSARPSEEDAAPLLNLLSKAPRETKKTPASSGVSASTASNKLQTAKTSPQTSKKKIGRKDRR